MLRTVSVLFMLLLSHSAYAATSATKDNITWNFNTDYTVGQYITGDWYVVAPSGLILNTVIASGGETISGTMLNPTPGSTQGYSSSAYNYDAAYDISTQLPYTLTVGATVISTTEHTYTTAEQTYINEAAILEVVSEAPPSGSFRPGYCDTNNTIYNESSIDYTKLGMLEPGGTAPSLVSTIDMFARPWIDHKLGWTGRMIHPNNNMRDYGAEVSTDVGIGALMLNSNFTNTEKRSLMVGYLQLGIDLYSIVDAGGGWGADGGHASGRKFPILFTGSVLNNQSMKDVSQKSGDYGLSGALGSPPADYISFGEDDQTFYVTQDDIDITNSGSWDPDTRNSSQHPYISSMIGMPEWGIRHTYLPEKSASEWDTYYRQCCTAYSWNGWALAAYVMGIDTWWNNDALFDYMDRYYAITHGDVDPFGYTVVREVSGYQTSNAWSLAMWDEYRDAEAPIPASKSLGSIPIVNFN